MIKRSLSIFCHDLVTQTRQLGFKIQNKVINCIVINQAFRLNNVTQLNEMCDLFKDTIKKKK